MGLLKKVHRATALQIKNKARSLSDAVDVQVRTRGSFLELWKAGGEGGSSQFDAQKATEPEP